MSFPRYPAYKDSRVEWLGEVPAHWSVAALNYRYEVQLGKMLDEKRITGESLAPYLRNVDVQWGRINVEDLPQMDFSGDDIERYGLRTGDLLVCEGGEVGRAAIWSGQLAECFYQKALHRLRARRSAADVPRFQMYLLRAAADLGIFLAGEGKSTIAHLTAEALRRYRFAYPAPEEQVAIVAFLDRETAKIDALIAEQERLIELLKEEFLSLALESQSHYASKSLRLGEAVEVMERPVNQREGEDYEPLGLFNRGRGVFHKETREMSEMGDSDFFWVEDGDLILSGQFAWEGAVALAGHDESRCVVSHRYAVLRGREGIALTEFLFALFLTDFGDMLLNESSRGAAGRNRPLNLRALLKEKIQIPDLHYQNEIVKRVHAWLALQTVTSEQTELLREFRAAVVSAAVTGQIDVRSAVSDAA